jgi:glyoxylase-like metal-dependent hydrolase (beta-lactamase superfamily II)
MNAVNISIFNAGFCTCPEHLAIQGGRWRNIRFPAMFALFEHPRFGAMLFDTGYSYRFFDETRSFPNRIYRMTTPVTLREEQLAANQLSAINIKPADITKIFISHFHADHIAALADFPRAKYVYLPQAYNSLRGLQGMAAFKHAYLPGLIPNDFDQRAEPVDVLKPVPLPPEFSPFTHAFDLLGDESLLAIELPGHANGQMGLFARDTNGEAYFFVADAAWLGRSIEENRPPHPVANLLFPDPSEYRTTLNNLHSFAKNQTSVHLIPSHCETTLRKYSSLITSGGPDSK